MYKCFIFISFVLMWQKNFKTILFNSKTYLRAFLVNKGNKSLMLYFLQRYDKFKTTYFKKIFY